MRKFVYAMILICAHPVFVMAQEGARATPQSTINGQLDAFQADDFARAFGFASPTIKDIFGTADRFGAMVQNGYPMVFRPKSVRMLGIREVDGQIWQQVMITDESGKTHLLDYQMIETPEGWQINAVQLLLQTGVGA
ncbi:DUF4864 domain-containing protein [Pseudorhodobacter sp. W20_MBD10_FR17]|uniref:DUF4864 domain-containing protein n=1 Tax=Pseudorhodobacter sp. W20_MBD10_FR17 TaxID=3240266 RepID=UPI003F9B9847